MNARFWKLFSYYWQANCLAWQHCPANPVVPPGQPEWKSRWTANPHFFEWKGRFAGQSGWVAESLLAPWTCNLVLPVP